MEGYAPDRCKFSKISKKCMWELKLYSSKGGGHFFIVVDYTAFLILLSGIFHKLNATSRSSTSLFF